MLDPTTLTDEQAKRCFELAFGKEIGTRPVRVLRPDLPKGLVYPVVSVVVGDLAIHDSLRFYSDGRLSALHWNEKYGESGVPIYARAVVQYLDSLTNAETEQPA